MVDINLFDDDASEEKEPFDDGLGSDSLDNHAGSSSDDLGGDLNLDDDLSSNNSGFGDDALLDSADTIPDFEDSNEDNNVDDYAFEGSGKKKSIPWIWIFLGVVVIGVVLYLYVIVPGQGPKPVRVQKPKSAQTGALSQTQAGSNVQDQIMPAEPSSPAQGIPVPGKTGNPVIAARAVFEDLSRKGSLGVVIVNGDQYLVQYISKTAGQGDAIGKSIQTLIGASSYELSPEDKQVSGGEILYSAVVSCVLPVQSRQPVTADQNPYKTTDQFNQRISELAKQNGLELRSTERISGSKGSDGKQPTGHLIVEGNKVQALNFLNTLNSLPGNWGLSRLQLNPLSNTDNSAEKVRIGLSFMVQIG